MKRVYFISSNKGKLNDYLQIIKEMNLDLELRHLLPVSEEAVYDSFEKTAKHKLLSNLPETLEEDTVYFAEDSGLCIDSLKGFPGVYSSFVLKTIGLNGILKLMDLEENRTAKFVCALAFLESPRKKLTKVVTGLSKGYIHTKPLGRKGFGYDPIFVPKGFHKTFAQDLNLKNQLSHRRQAFEKMLNTLFRGKNNATITSKQGK
ncbi:MAG: non-canonical purine NTP pyrophosphatase [Candidatus Micrarchaeota archaeon]|nr:non-canonical purine NTP pyrophosphatase [Candidatus Micrarchaeota archaeon]